ncbi:hypothetical protein MDIS_01420 [Mesomycoplasma dispar]|nr:hypothetical protein MDIS_01420 [Mesomycoplasma dispar]
MIIKSHFNDNIKKNQVFFKNNKIVWIFFNICLKKSIMAIKNKFFKKTLIFQAFFLASLFFVSCGNKSFNEIKNPIPRIEEEKKELKTDEKKQKSEKSDLITKNIEPKDFSFLQSEVNDRQILFNFSIKFKNPNNLSVILENNDEIKLQNFTLETSNSQIFFLVPQKYEKIVLKSIKDGNVLYLFKRDSKLEFSFTNKFEKNEKIEWNLVKFSDSNRRKDEIYPTDLKLDEIKIELVGKSKEKYELIKLLEFDPFFNQREKNISDWLGAIGLVIKLKNKKTNEQEIKKIELKGFKNNPFDGQKDYDKKISYFDNLDRDYLEYAKLDQRSRFEFDNKNYISGLSNNLSFHGKNPLKYRKNLDFNAKKAIDIFDKKARFFGIENYKNSYIKGFTLPKFDQNNNFLGLNFYDGAKEIPKASIRTDFIGKNQWKFTGLPRHLVNKMYKKIALQTFGIEFTNRNDLGQNFGTAGTMWILDFEKTKDGKYPTKWYFGTNLHVADNLMFDKTQNVIITKLDSETDLDKKFSTVNNDSSFQRFYFKKPAILRNFISKIFLGSDFLKSKPSDFLEEKQAKLYEKSEEFIDFAVLELDFSRITSQNDLWIWSFKPFDQNQLLIDQKYGEIKTNPEKLAELLTNNYANLPDSHISFKQNSYLDKYSEIDKKIISTKDELQKYKGESLFAVGFPSSSDDFYLQSDDKQNKDDAYSRRNETFSLWTNSEPQFYDKNSQNLHFSEKLLDQGDYLSSQIGYRTFWEKPGIVDAFLSFPNIYKSVSSFENSGRLISSGLNYIVKNFATTGGASGSSFRNQKNELVGVYHFGNKFAKTGLIAAFRSEGFNYFGLFGKYNLAQYDLIYGGGKDQKNSYRQALFAKKGQISTNLFPNGLLEIPNNFKFLK